MNNPWLHVLLVGGWLLSALTFSFLWAKRAGDIHAVKGALHPQWAYFYEFVSNFVGSFAGWCCLYALAVRASGAGPALHSLNGVDIFLFFAAIVGVSGRLAETIHRFIDAIGAFVGAVAKKLEP
jgi:hypothetical protein